VTSRLKNAATRFMLRAFDLVGLRALALSPCEGALVLTDRGAVLIMPPDIDRIVPEEEGTITLSNVLLLRALEVMLHRANTPLTLAEAVMQGCFELGLPIIVGEEMMRSMTVWAEENGPKTGLVSHATVEFPRKPFEPEGVPA
jgi:hypothetical protein